LKIITLGRGITPTANKYDQFRDRNRDKDWL